MTIYVDEIFLVNLWMDGLLLWATGKLARQSGSRWRLAAAALLGALYAVNIFFPWGIWLALLPVKLGWSLLMLRVAFPFRDWRQYGRLLVYFYLVSFVLAGAAMALPYLLEQQAVQTWNGIALAQIDFQLFWLAWAAVVVLILAWLLRQRLHRDLSDAPCIWMAQIGLQGRQITVPLLLDTGNHLTDPLSAEPVLVVEQNYALPLLGEQMASLLQQKPALESDQLLLAAQHTELSGKLRLIPYQTVGQAGLLLAVRADFVQLCWGKREIFHNSPLIALTRQPFSSNGSYHGLVQPELL